MNMIGLATQANLSGITILRKAASPGPAPDFRAGVAAWGCRDYHLFLFFLGCDARREASSAWWPRWTLQVTPS